MKFHTLVMSMQLSSLDDLVALGYICKTSVISTDRILCLHQYAVGCNELEQSVAF
jgi:hypothetical protein